MAIIKPFRGWRYNTEKIVHLHDVFSPLFDVVLQEQLENLYANPYNSIYLSLPKSHESSVETITHWKQENILVQDAFPSIYPYSQKFGLKDGSEFYSRRGFIAMVKMHKPGEEPSVLLHEQTIPDSVQDRVQLLSKTMLNVSPTHGFYDDPHFVIENLLSSFYQNPLIKTIDYQNVVNKLNVVQNRKIIEKIQHFLSDQQIILADGHHRFASSFQFRNQFYEQNPHADPDHIANYHMMFLTNIRGSDVKILPTHRYIQSDDSWNEVELKKKAEEYFQIIKIQKNISISKEIEGTKYCYGIQHKDFQWILILKPEFQNPKRMEMDLPDVVKKLEYTMMHYYWIDKVLGFPYAEQSNYSQIQYTKELQTIYELTQNPNFLGIIVNEVAVEDMLKVCKSGALMPQKSTFFYPKVISGFVFASIQENENNSPFDLSFKVSS